MDFQPYHKHPFSYADALKLETAVITQEITRLQNSLVHLERTNVELSQYIKDTPEGESDTELRDVLSENIIAIAAQRERILMLSTVLVQRGEITGTSHYQVTTSVEVTVGGNSRGQENLNGGLIDHVVHTSMSTSGIPDLNGSSVTRTEAATDGVYL